MWNRKTDRGEAPAPWSEYARPEEKDRLALIARRLAVKSSEVEQLLAERRKIMRRAIARMRRKEGKE